jgi:hypothetical protein
MTDKVVAQEMLERKEAEEEVVRERKTVGACPNLPAV